MNIDSAKSVAGKYLAVSAAFITLLITTTTSDPVNVPKMVALVISAFGLLAVILVSDFKNFINGHRNLVIALGLFIATAVWAVVNSASPFNQNFYGTFGRNTGFLTYLALAMLCFVSATLASRYFAELILKALLFAGVVNLIYCLWVVIFGDFISWSNPYGNILGTLGNPNFIGSFLGILVTVMLAFVLDPKTSTKLRLAAVVAILVALFEVQASKAVQGVVLSAGGSALVVFYYLRSRLKGYLVLSAYSLGVMTLGVFAVLGALQKGPLAEIVYKTSVSLRGEYWQAALKMAELRPFTGVGMDSYGDWYRRARSEQAMILPGPSVVTNAAHSVPLDFLAYGGWPLFIAFLIIFALSVIAIIKITIREKEFNWVTVGLIGAWTCYQVQSLISINQIGLAIWGWITMGALIGYEKATRSKSDTISSERITKKSLKRRESNVISPQLVFGIGGLVGLFIALPAFTADSTYKSAVKAGNLQSLEKALAPSYLTPRNTFFLGSAVELLITSKLDDLAYKYAKQGVEFNPQAHDAWRMLYYTPTVSPEDKALAKTKLIELDPLNEEWKKLP
ncbi:RfaL Lipid A core - O-antigen ligase and related enzymes [Candidatus Nanopelagicaceae bacterium]